WGEPADCGWYYVFNVHNRRQTRKNLQLVKECVISYYPYSLMKQSWITGMPIPSGISELDIAKLTPLKSTKVAPPGVLECVSNVEVKILDTYPLSNNTLFIGRVVGCSVDEEALERDMKIEDEPGLAGADLLYECSITGKTPRLNYGRLDMEKRYRTDDNLGDAGRWIGNFGTWMESELKRGRINQTEYDRLMDLNHKWLENRNEKSNAAVKEELTAILRDVCWREV
ncbi:MAG: flavin reductase, partial [Planctomycetes bacterium]|nr:flavin reductase [Planctomycetota bacterium]